MYHDTSKLVLGIRVARSASVSDVCRFTEPSTLPYSCASIGGDRFYRSTTDALESSR